MIVEELFYNPHQEALVILDDQGEYHVWALVRDEWQYHSAFRHQSQIPEWVGELLPAEELPENFF